MQSMLFCDDRSLLEMSVGEFLFGGLVLLRITLCAFSSFGKGKIIAQNVGTKIGLIGHIYFGIFCTGCGGENLYRKWTCQKFSLTYL